MRRWLLLLIGLILALTGCGYETKTQSRTTEWGVFTSTDTARFGQVRFVLVEEYRRPKGIARFPDGGRTYQTAQYFILYQKGDATAERQIARIDFTPVRAGDFGNSNLGESKVEWVAPDRLHYRVAYGYFDSELQKVLEGEVAIPPLP